jgi:hypothetical protein
VVHDAKLAISAGLGSQQIWANPEHLSGYDCVGDGPLVEGVIEGSVGCNSWKEELNCRCKRALKRLRYKVKPASASETSTATSSAISNEAPSADDPPPDASAEPAAAEPAL